MRQAIQTRYLGPTDHRGSRVKAFCQAGNVTIPWDDALDINLNHHRAFKALADKLGWKDRWHVGALPDNSGNVYVLSSAPFLDTWEAVD